MAERDEFIALYERDAEAVLVFLTRRTLEVEVALDLTAETFAQAWRGWPSVRVDSTEEVRGWLFTIARRQLGRYMRRGQIERRALRRMGVTLPALHEDDIAQIEHELPYREVARRLGITEPAARARVSRGLRALAGALEPLVSQEAGAS
jgi:RNA polymerase sigma-70 factor (ECF subfamily)